MRRGALALWMLVLASVNLAAQGQSRVVADSAAREVRNVLIRLQVAIRNDDWRTVATLIQFPLGVDKGRRGVTSVPSVAVFMKTYPIVFTRNLRDAILKESPESLRIENGRASAVNGRLVIGIRCDSTSHRSCHRGVTVVQPY
jgi:hypothetical protein